jgi:hypothetical protein
MHNWACYDFGRYQHVLEAWIATQNKTFKFGQVAGLNVGLFRDLSEVVQQLEQVSFIKNYKYKGQSLK